MSVVRVAERMSIKPISVVWNLLAVAHHHHHHHREDSKVDVGRLLRDVAEVEGTSKVRMLADNKQTLADLQAML